MRYCQMSQKKATQDDWEDPWPPDDHWRPGPTRPILFAADWFCLPAATDSVVGLVPERDLYLGPVRLHFAVLDLHVEF